MTITIYYRYLLNIPQVKDYLKSLGYQVKTIRKFLKEEYKEKHIPEKKYGSFSEYQLNKNICWRTEDEYKILKYTIDYYGVTFAAINFSIDRILTFTLISKLPILRYAEKAYPSGNRALYIVTDQKTINRSLKKNGYQVKTLRKFYYDIKKSKEEIEDYYTHADLNVNYAVKDLDSFYDIIKNKDKIYDIYWKIYKYRTNKVFSKIVENEIYKEITNIQ